MNDTQSMFKIHPTKLILRLIFKIGGQAKKSMAAIDWRKHKWGSTAHTLTQKTQWDKDKNEENLAYE